VINSLRTVHKVHPHSGGGEQYGHFADKGRFISCGRSHFLMQKTLDFLQFMVCLHGQGVRGLSQCGQGERGQFFAILCRRPLWTVPKFILYNQCLYEYISILMFLGFMDQLQFW